MKRYTLLEVVQEMARHIGADEVDILDESVESLDMAGIAVATLNDIISRQAWEFLSDRVITVASSNGFVFSLPQDVLEVLEVYATAGSTRDQNVPYAMPQYFVRRAALNVSGTPITIPNTGILTLNPTGLPTRYTSFDEVSIVLLNNAPTNTIRIRARVGLDMSGAGNRAAGYVESWVPAIPLRMFNYWIYEASAAASATLRQAVDQRLEGMAQRAYDALMRNPAVTRLETQQRKFSKELDARTSPSTEGMTQPRQAGGNQQ